MRALQTAADVLGIGLDKDGNSDEASVVINWGGRRVEYRVAVVADVVTENLYVAVVKLPGYVRGLLVVDRRGSSERIQLHLYDGSRKKVGEIRKGNLFLTLSEVAPLVTSSNEFGGGLWYPVSGELSITA